MSPDWTRGRKQLAIERQQAQFTAIEQKLTLRKPTFLCVGMPKCGTTTLHTYLSQHPGVSMPLVKERGFFGGNHLSLAEFEGSWGDAPVRGECDPSYYKYPDEIRIRYMSVKIIFLVRDPVERLFSHVQHNIHRQLQAGQPGSYEYDFSTLLAQARNVGLSSPVLEASDYRTMIAPFRRFEHRVFSFADLLSDQSAFFASICDFIGADRWDAPSVHSNQGAGLLPSMDTATENAFRDLYCASTEWLRDNYGIDFVR